MEEHIINGENALLGRLCSYVAKQSLLGKNIVILNSKKVLISGSKKNILKNYKEKRGRVGSSQKGPKISRLPVKILKRTIRGMLPHTQGRGKDALKRVMCYEEIPEKYKDKKAIFMKGKTKGKNINLGELCKLI